MTTQPLSTDVLIIGAGPTGLMLANWLVRLGVRVLILDRKGGPTRESRALVVQARSLEVYDQLGLGAEVLEQGRQINRLSVWSGQTRTVHLTLGRMGVGRTPFPFLFTLEQSQNETILYDHLRAQGGDVQWQTTLESLTQNSAGVSAVYHTPGGTQHTVHARYACGADGARSFVRHTLNMPFAGTTNDMRFYVADAIADGAVIEGEVNLKLDRNIFLGAFPIPGKNHFRLLGIARESGQQAGEITFEDVRDQSERLGINVHAVLWFSSYKVNHRVAAHFRQGRVFLLGDAAHVHSPVGGQGMNTGLLDAHNLAWKLAAVVHGTAGESLLNTYEAERRPFAQRLVATTDRAFGIITNPNPLWERARGELLPRLAGRLVGDVRDAAMPTALFGTISQINLNYRKSTLSWGQAGKIKGGDRLPFVPLAKGSNFDALKDARAQIHVYGMPSAELLAWLQSFGEIELRVFPYSPAAHAAGLQANAVYLVRPDGYVSVAMPQFDPAALKAVLANGWSWQQRKQHAPVLA